MYIPIDYKLLDQKICAINDSIETNVLKYINPQNVESEKKKFFEALNKGDKYNPKFIYAPRNPIYSYFAITPSFDTYRRELKELVKGLGHDSMGLIFEKKALDLFERMELIRSSGTENFPHNSEEYFGKVDKELLSVAKELVKIKFIAEKKTIPFVKAKKVITAELVKRGLSNHKVTARETAGSKYSVRIISREIVINKDYLFSKTELKRLVAHEIEAHIYRYENGLNQPYHLFAHGISKDNLETEEGLAVKVEEKYNINVDEQLKSYAGRVIAINSASQKGFCKTFEDLQEWFSDEDAFTLTLRAKRGTFRTDKPGAFTKDLLYLKGKLSVEKFLEDHPMKELYFGRYSIYDYDLVKDIDGLKKPKYLPNFIK